MIFDRKDTAAHLARLKDNVHFSHYVSTLEESYNKLTEQLLHSDHPDEALRGECRTLLKMLKFIHQNLKGTTL